MVIVVVDCEANVVVLMHVMRSREILLKTCLVTTEVESGPFECSELGYEKPGSLSTKLKDGRERTVP